MNKMTAANLAVVFGSNLAWPKEKVTTIENVTKINSFMRYLLNNVHQVFTN